MEPPIPKRELKKIKFGNVKDNNYGLKWKITTENIIDNGKNLILNIKNENIKFFIHSINPNPFDFNIKNNFNELIGFELKNINQLEDLFEETYENIISNDIFIKINDNCFSPINKRGNNLMNIIELEDHYDWLRDDTRKNIEVLDHLKKENEYTEYVMKDTKKLEDELYNEILSHIKEDNDTYPLPPSDIGWDSEYYYFIRTKKGKSYPYH